MNIFLWALQVLLALHTAIGAFWKFSHSAEQTMPSLKAIPPMVWLGMSGFEILCCLGLVLPFFNGVPQIFAPIAAAGIALEMLAFCGVHIFSGDTNYGPMIYWLVVAAIAGVIIYGRSR